MTKIKLNRFSKIAGRGNKVSHAKNRTKRVFKANLHHITLNIEGNRVKTQVPSSVLKVLKREKMLFSQRNEK
jgi:ribosomal protein L28